MRSRVALLVVSVLLIYAVTTGASETNRILKVMDWKLNETPQMQAWFQQVKERFEADHPDVTIEYVFAPFGAPYNERIILSTIAGDAPDVVSLSVLWGRDLYEQGLLLPLNDLIEETPELAPDQFIPTTQVYNTKDGVVFGIPTAMDSATLMYDLDAFEEAGYDTDPHALNTWDESATAAQKMTLRDGDRIVRYGYGGPVNMELLGAWFTANGASYYNEDLTGPGLNTPAAVEAAQFVYDLQHTYGVLGGHFRHGGTAMGYGITSHPYFLASERPDLRFNMTTYPAGPSGSSRGTLTWANMHSITATSENMDLAWEFIQYYAGLEGNIDIFNFLGYASSPRLDFYQSDEWRLAQTEYNWLPAIPELAMAGGVYPFIRSTQLTTQVWNPLLGPAFRGERTIDSAFAEGDRIYNIILKQ